ncbi:PREDICTED: uncharacterized protein LOC109209691 [Nicotiana attenuata]|uniref:uncharacterized protein LOC109209691 n=1 Tax=Nicotiana attenuata TaxID=49451 RepID=UPI0009052AD5|nr:PREDICTED: uncharacterized protein LOC109209691 [Nicotiana attenuata]
MDVWGPHKVPTYDRKLYFVTIVDDYSRFTWVCLIQSKCEVVTVIKNFLAMIKTQFEATVKIVRSDNDSTEDLFASPPVVEETRHQPQAPIITTSPQSIQVPVNANGTTEVETPDMNLVTDHAECSDNHKSSDDLDPATVHAESDVQHEIPADTSANENPFPIILEPEVETSIEEARSEDVHSQLPSIEGQIKKSNQQGKGRPPVWLNDYITKAKAHTNTIYSIFDVLSYDHLSPAYQSFLNVFSVLTEPQSFKEAAHDPRWIETMDQEIRALEENHT